MTPATMLSHFNAIRAQTLGLFDAPAAVDAQRSRALMAQLNAVPGILDIECASHLLADLQRCASGEAFALRETRGYFNQPASDTLISILSAPYARPMGLEYLKFGVLPVDPALRKYETNVMPVVIREATDGLLPVHTVAIFPENHVGATQQPGDKIYYLINKFAHRHHQLTQRIIEHLTTPDSFAALRGASYAEIEQATVYWVWLHEYNHQRVGDLPIPAYLKLKSSRLLAGLEELRVDIGSALMLLDDASSFQGRSRFLFEFILSERLLRYGVDGLAFDDEGQAVPSYDALSSYMFFNLLRRHGAIEVVGGAIDVQDNFVPALRAILAHIQAIEARIHRLPLEQVRSDMLDFVLAALETSGPTLHYQHAHYDTMREALLALGVAVAMS